MDVGRSQKALESRGLLALAMAERIALLEED